MDYALLKALHLVGVVMLLGNAAVTLLWKMAADRSGDPRVVAFAQRLVTATDWSFTVGGVALIAAGGYGAAWVGHLNLLGTAWLLWGQALLILSGAIWAAVLVPIQIRQARAAQVFAAGGEIPLSYWRMSHRWMLWGLAAMAPLLVALVVMVAKPS